MNRLRAIATILCVTFSAQAFAEMQDIDKELSDLAERLVAPIKDHAKKKVAVIDFADLQGSPQGELGKYIAEQLTVDLVMGKRDFSVLDRANLKKILAEHKLTSQGLIDPDNAKKLGMFAGVDALVLGTIIPKGTNSVRLTAKVITTDTAEIVGAARAEFKYDSTVQDLVSKPAAGAKADGGSTFPGDDRPSVAKSFGDLRIEVRPLQVVNRDQLQLTMTLTNQNARKPMWAAISTDLMGNIKGVITDPSGAQYFPNRTSVSGVQMGTFALYGYTPNSFSPATELKAGDAVTATLVFLPRRRGQEPASGRYHLQMEILQGRNYDSAATGVSFANLVADLDVSP